MLEILERCKHLHIAPTHSGVDEIDAGLHTTSFIDAFPEVNAGSRNNERCNYDYKQKIRKKNKTINFPKPLVLRLLQKKKNSSHLTDL